MKHFQIRPISDAEYEQRLNSLISRVQIRLRYTESTGEMRLMAEAWKRITERQGSGTIADLRRELGLAGDDTLVTLKLLGRTRNLQDDGLVEHVGYATDTIPGRYRKYKRTGRLYRFVRFDKPARIKKVMDWFEQEVEKLDQRRQRASCVAGISQFALTARKVHWPDEDMYARNQAIVDMYGQGFTMEEIGREFGISRERVRQIIDIAIRNSRE